MIDDVDGEVADQKNLRAVQGAVIVINVDLFLDLGLDHTLGQEAVVVHDHMIDIEDIGVAGITKIFSLYYMHLLNIAYYYYILKGQCRFLKSGNLFY